MGKHKTNSSLGNPKNSVHPWFPYSLNVFLYLRVFPHKSCHITYHEAKLNLQPDHQHDHLIHKWKRVLTGSLDSVHFAGMGGSRHPVTWGPMVNKYKHLVFKGLRYKVKFLAFIIIWFSNCFQQASEADKCGHWRNFRYEFCLQLLSVLYDTQYSSGNFFLKFIPNSPAWYHSISSIINQYILKLQFFSLWNKNCAKWRPYLNT